MDNFVWNFDEIDFLTRAKKAEDLVWKQKKQS